MTLADFASLGTAVSGIAVTASIVYLAIQTQQNTRRTRAAIQQGSAAWISGNGGTASPEEIRKQQFALHCATAVNAMEDTYAQYRDGLLSEEQFARNCDTYRDSLADEEAGQFTNRV